MTVLMLSVGIFQMNPANAATDTLAVNADAAILIDAKTGKILYEKNADTALGVASMTKMMTEYLLLEAIQDGRVTFDQQYNVSELVYKVSQDRALSNVPLRADGTYSVQELYEAMVIYSANGATMALAEVIAGSETEFVKLMNEKGKELGLKEFRFVNSSGLNNRDLKGMHPEGTGPEDENIMSAKDTALLAQKLLMEFPEVLETSGISRKVFRDGTDDAIKMDNWNWMLPGLLFEYEGVDGIKTGTTDFAGYCFTATAERNGQRYITVVMNAKNADGQGSYQARFGETKKMLDFAFGQHTKEEVLPAGFAMEDTKTLPVTKGKEDSVQVETEKSLEMVIRNGQAENYTPVFTVDESLLNEDGQLTAPIEKGTRVGSIKLQYNGEGEDSYLTEELAQATEVPVVTTTSVEKANWFVLSMRGIGGFFSGVWDSIASTVKGWF